MSKLTTIAAAAAMLLLPIAAKADGTSEECYEKVRASIDRTLPFPINNENRKTLRELLIVTGIRFGCLPWSYDRTTIADRADELPQLPANPTDAQCAQYVNAIPKGTGFTDTLMAVIDGGPCEDAFKREVNRQLEISDDHRRNSL